MTADAVGGIWNYAVELARALDHFDCDVLLAVTGPAPNASQMEEMASVPHVAMVAIPSKLEWMESPWDDVRRTGYRLLELAQEWQPDVVHLNSYSYASASWDVPIVVVAHSCVLSWWRAVKLSDPPVEWNRYKREVERGLESAHVVVAPTGTLLSALKEHYTWDSPAVVIPNGISGCFACQTPKHDFVFAVGRIWDEAKNFKALASVSRMVPWPILVAGDISLASNTAGRGDLKALGRLSSSATREWMSMAGIYAFPAKYEPFGLSILEAASAGCPLILGDIPSLRENWEDAAVFVEPDDRLQLADALNALICDSVSRATLGEKAKSRAAHLSSARMAENYASLYESLRTGRIDNWLRNVGAKICAS